MGRKKTQSVIELRDLQLVSCGIKMNLEIHEVCQKKKKKKKKI
jgi:hypothetical protein